VYFIFNQQIFKLLLKKRLNSLYLHAELCWTKFMLGSASFNNVPHVWRAKEIIFVKKTNAERCWADKLSPWEMTSSLCIMVLVLYNKTSLVFRRPLLIQKLFCKVSCPAILPVWRTENGRTCYFANDSQDSLPAKTMHCLGLEISASWYFNLKPQ